MNNAILAMVSVALIIIGIVILFATRDPGIIHELRCERRGVTVDTTMTELRKPGPYVIGLQEDGDAIAIPKDGIRCTKID